MYVTRSMEIRSDNTCLFTIRSPPPGERVGMSGKLPTTLTRFIRPKSAIFVTAFIQYPVLDLSYNQFSFSVQGIVKVFCSWPSHGL